MTDFGEIWHSDASEMRLGTLDSVSQ